MRPIATWPILIVALWSCGSAEETGKRSFRQLEGETMGTYYRISYEHPTDRDVQPSVDSLLLAINAEVSTYDPASTISNFNRAVDTFELRTQPLSSDSRDHQDRHFLINFLHAVELHKATEGAFDPTVMPLVNYWGFGYTGREPVVDLDSMAVDSLLQLVGLERLTLQLKDRYLLIKDNPGIQLDFSALAKGYAVDEIGGMFDHLGIQHYLVEIGGEVLARGMNAKGRPWQIGINLPKEGAGTQELQTVVPLQNRALATSGNYRNFYEVEGVKYSHTINPETGFPERNTLLSASVFAPDCITADAYATAFMVMGPSRALAMAEELQSIEAYLIVGAANGQLRVQYTSGLASILQQTN